MRVEVKSTLHNIYKISSINSRKQILLFLKPSPKIHHIRTNSEQRLTQELRYASHLGMPAIMVSLTSPNHTNLARMISNHVFRGASCQIWVQVPLTAPDMSKYETTDETETTDTWDWWNRFRLMTNSNSKINLCLVITENCPSDLEVKRWLGEPIKTVSTGVILINVSSLRTCSKVRVSTSLFLINKKGYPVLSKQHQNLIKNFINLDIQVKYLY